MKPTRRRNAKRLELPETDDDGVAVGGMTSLTKSRAFRICIITLAIGVPLFMLYAKSQIPPAYCQPTVKPTLPTTVLPRYHGPAVEFPSRFTLVLNSYKRHRLLQRAIAHYSRCSGIDAIRVVWCEDGLPPTRAKNRAFYSEHKEVRFDIMPNSSLNSRFTPLEGLRTEAVFSIDDDIIASCQDLQHVFQVWKADKRNMVGFYPRIHVQDAQCRYKYSLGFGTLAWRGEYSMVLTKAAMLHRDYLEVYTNHMPKAIRDYVDSVRNCEDIAMSFLVANATGEAPHFVHSSRVIDLGKGLLKVRGISSGIRHQQSRGVCLEEFRRQYGGVMPLVVRSVSEHRGALGLRLSPLTDGLVAMLHGHF